ncbi:MAG: hypothetical protein ACKOW9_02610 [Candidatus Paceibacterota bacterium]
MATILFKVLGLTGLQGVFGYAFAIILSKLLKGSGSGWGDLIGIVVGLYLGSWIGFLLGARFITKLRRWVFLFSALLWYPFTMLSVTLSMKIYPSFILTWVGSWSLIAFLTQYIGRRYRKV